MRAVVPLFFFTIFSPMKINSHDLVFEQLVGQAYGIYMADSCERRVHSDWQGYPVERCSYQVVDNDGKTKTAIVNLLIPPVTLASKWIGSACSNATKKNECHQQVVSQIRRSSGFQFPVSGVVYEDIIPKDGVFEAYCFRDGVTVIVDRFIHRSTHTLSTTEIETCISGKLKKALKYARVHSGVREDYIEFGGTEDVGSSQPANGKLHWLNIVRESYQSAWQTGSYSLLNFWVQRNILTKQ